MTLMLASVRDAAEAELALAGGADVIDFKDPAAGALGPLALDAVKAGVAAVAGRRPTSATVGDPPYDEAALVARARALAEAGVDTVKLALDSDALDRLGAALEPLARAVKLVGVLLADRAPEFALLDRFAALGFAGALIDTADKRGGRLLDHCDIGRLDAFRRGCEGLGLTSALAGSLEAPDVPRLLLVKPTLLGFRGALCGAGGRKGSLDARAVALIRDLIPRERPAEGEAAENVDWRLMGRGLVAGGAADETVDTVFLRDHLVEARIGAYAHERGATQRVRFSVEASVARAALGDDMRAVFSYDLILDAIRLVVGRGHVGFVETLAEEVAAMILAHPRVRATTVKVEKLDVAAGAVGVEIRRERPASPAAVEALFARPARA